MKRIILSLFLLLLSFNIYSSEKPAIYLATFGPGDELFLRWGHFGIIVDYPDSKDVMYDYGNFTFNDEDFVPNFIKGIMTYFKYRKSADREISLYKHFNRTITLQELNLTDEQISTYIDKLNFETRKDNMFYQYDHYYNNCVSTMADYLNEITDGEFYRGSDKKTGRSFRDLSRDYISSNYLYNLLIMTILGSKVDYTITEKEALFLPDYTMQRADEVMIPDGNGGLKPLVKSKEVIYESVGRDPVIVNAKPKTLLNLLIGIILAFAGFLINKNRVVSSITLIITGFSGGIFGSILFFMAFFTGHYYIHTNWNLIFLNPLTFILLVSGIMKIKRSLSSKGDRLYTRFIDVTLIMTVIMLMLKSAGLVVQENLEIISLIAPLLVVNSSFKTLFGSQTGRSRRLSFNSGNSSDAALSSDSEDNTTA